MHRHDPLRYGGDFGCRVWPMPYGPKTPSIQKFAPISFISLLYFIIVLEVVNRSSGRYIRTAAIAMQATYLAKSHSVLKDCPWPIRIIARHRDLDFTSCFEHLVLLPAPLLLTLGCSIAQTITLIKKRKSGLKWIDRGEAGERIGRMKVVSFPNGPSNYRLYWPCPLYLLQHLLPYLSERSNPHPHLHSTMPFLPSCCSYSLISLGLIITLRVRRRISSWSFGPSSPLYRLCEYVL
jgi:hypothetical protein